MIIKTIEYSESHESVTSIGLKKWRKVGMSAEIDETEDSQLATLELKKKVEIIFKVDEIPLEYGPITKLSPTPPPVIDRRAIERLEILIDDAKSLYDLQILQGQVGKYGLQEAYDKKMAELMSTANQSMV